SEPCRLADPAHLFFFQAEDGIRDFHVTGVQTCALPISSGKAFTTSSVLTPHSAAMRSSTPSGFAASFSVSSRCFDIAICSASNRSEERRVGNECLSQSPPER